MNHPTHNFQMTQRVNQTLFWTATAAVLVCAGAVQAQRALKPRPETIKPQQVILQPYHRDDVVTVKFHDDIPIRLRQNILTDFDLGFLDEPLSQAALAKVAGGVWQRTSIVNEDELDQMRQTAQMKTGKAIADFNTRYHIFLPDGVDIVEVIDAFNALDIIEIATPAAHAPPSPGPCASLGNVQGYLNAGPAGLNALNCWSPIGTKGGSVNLVDIEQGYNAHIDLPAISQIGPPPDAFIPAIEKEHGTAVFGIIAGLHDGCGIWGMAPQVSGLGIAYAIPAGGVWDVASAVLNAIANTGPGDVILIEQQWFGPNFNAGNANCPGQFGMAPVEWRPAEYNAIVTAVANGRIVVEAAGNGAQNLDSAVYLFDDPGTPEVENHQPFTPGNESGAIMVGAGHPGSTFFGTDVERSRVFCSNYGSRVNVQGWGAGIVTTGYGDHAGTTTFDFYTRLFGGTSGAAAQVAGAAILVQSAFKIANSGPTPLLLTPQQMRTALVSTGEAQQAGTFPVSQNIGPRPDAAFAALSVLGGGCVPLWNTTIGSPGFDDNVNDIVVFDDGNGDALYAGGRFDNSGANFVSGVARWNGTNWISLGNFDLGFIDDLEVFDDGNGDALYLAGQPGVMKWSGTQWDAVGVIAPAGGQTRALAVYNDGGGSALYAGGTFGSPGNPSTNKGIAKWNGTSWTSLGTGLDNDGFTFTVNVMTSFNDGSGDKLYIGGQFSSAGGVAANGFATWDGTNWAVVGDNSVSTPFALRVLDDGSGAKLYVGGQTNLIVTWDGTQYTALNSPPGNLGIVEDFEMFDDGTGKALHAVYSGENAGSFWAIGIAKWDNGQWWPLADGILGDGNALLVFDDGSGKALYVGGQFGALYDLPAGNIARWNGCAPAVQPCPADCAQPTDGVVNVTDLLKVLADWGGPGSCDIDGNGVTNVTDLLTILGAWGVCP